MSRIIVTALSALTMVALGIVALQYRTEALAAESLSGNEAEAFNLSVAVSSDAMAITGNALPWLFVAVLLAFVVVVLLMSR